MIYKADAPNPNQRPNKRRKRRSRLLLVLLVSLVITALIAAAIIIASSSGNGLSSLVSGQLSQLPATGDKDKPQRPPELSGETFTYNDETLYAAAGVRKNEYSDAGFKYDDKGRLTYSADGKTAKLGVDVSSHQENIDWAAVKSSGVDFAMIRVGYRGNTEGKLNLDNTYHQNMRDAANAGLDVGVYFYAQAINANEAREEAEWVIDLLEGYEISYPVVYDWEYVFGDTRSANVGGETVTRCCEMFCSAIEEKGYTPMLYFYRDLAYRTLDLSRLAKYDFWLAEYNEKPSFYYHFEMLQFTNAGEVNGIDGGVDLNLCFKDYGA